MRIVSGSRAMAKRIPTASLATLFGVLSFCILVPLSSVAESDVVSKPIVLFVHGRGQSEKHEADVRGLFYDTFEASQKKHTGSVIIGTEDLRFVWYADVIDPRSQPPQFSQNCRFAEDRSLPTSIKQRLRNELIDAAQKRGLDDFGLKVLARDTFLYLSQVAVRCEADARVLREVEAAAAEGRGIIVVAHSMGGIVSFSAIQKLSQVASSSFSIAHFVTVGTQVGLEPVLRGLSGEMVRPPVPVPVAVQKWTNFMNRGDALAFETEGMFEATDRKRKPFDDEINAEGRRHAITTYLNDRNVVTSIVDTWCALVGEANPNCASAMSSTNAVSREILESMRVTEVQRISDFLGTPVPLIEENRVGLNHVSEVGGRYIVSIGLSRVSELAGDLDAQHYRKIVEFLLAHEIAHIAAATRISDDYRARTIRESECEADMWAGLWIGRSLEIRSVKDSLQTVLAAIGFVADLGEEHLAGGAAFGDDSLYPSTEQRAFCAARGVSGGLHWASIARARSGDSRGHQEYQANLERDPSLFHTPDDVQQWVVSNVSSIVGDDEISSAVTPPAEIFLELASNARSGATELYASASDLSQKSVCKYTRIENETVVRFECPILPSTGLRQANYESFIAVARPWLLGTGWSQNDGQVDGSDYRTFSNPEATVTIYAGTENRGLSFEIQPRY